MIPGILKVEGMERFQMKLRTLLISKTKGAERGMVEAGLHLLRASVKYVPIQIGNLKRSGFVKKRGHGFRTDVYVGYGGDAAPYALYVHEDMTKAHGRAFNIKHAKKIAGYGRVVTSKKTKKSKWKPYGKMGTVQGGWFPRKLEEQAKYLEKPVKEERGKMMSIILSEATK